MSQPLTIGVDFGSTGLRVAYLGAGGQPSVLPPPAEPASWILCERHPGCRLGVAFRSVKSRLGAPGGAPLEGAALAPLEERVTETFRALKRGVEEHTARAVTEAVLAVPALYSASQRSALRGAVLAAGFSEVHLLNDSVAAAIAQAAHQDRPATVLVCAMGYAGFEFGLVRVARGHYRALGYEGGWSPGGWAFDQLLLESVLGFFEERRLRLESAGWDAARWLRLRAMTEWVKERLSVEARVAFPFMLQSADGRPLGQLLLGRAGFEEAIRPSCLRALEQVAGLLEHAGLAAEELDAVLLVGGSTQSPALQAMVASVLGREPLLLDREALARGAALFTAQLGSRPAVAGAEQERASAGAGNGEVTADLAALRAALAVADSPPAPVTEERLVLVAGDGPDGSSHGVQPLLQPAQHLLEQGRTVEARALLEELVREASAMLQRLDGGASPAPLSSGVILARRALARAQQLLKKGQYEEAVRESHLAWEQDRDNPDTFEGMIDVHCQAATARNTAEGYADAQRWLQCAYTHDESNTRVRSLIADRHFAHARQLTEQGRRKQALETLEHCFAWNPEHPGARELQANLTRR